MYNNNNNNNNNNHYVVGSFRFLFVVELSTARVSSPIFWGDCFRDALLLTNPYSQLSRPILLTTHHIRGDQATHEIKKNSKFNPYGCCAVVGRDAPSLRSKLEPPFRAPLRLRCRRERHH